MSPYEIPALAGQPYRPSNGSEGSMFMSEFCERCTKDAKYRETQDGKDGCSIIRDSLIGQAKEWTHDFMGRPTCTEFKEAS